MKPRPNEDPMTRALLEVAHSVRGLISRTRGIQELGSGDPMSPLLQRSRALVRHLEQAVDELAAFDSDRTFVIDKSKGKQSDKVIVRCVETVIEDTQFAQRRDGEASADVVGLRGTAASFGIPEVLSFLESMDKTGTLLVTTFVENFSIVLEEGEVVHAASDATPPGLRLGDILVQQGATTYADLKRFIEANRESRLPLGELVVREGIAEREDLEEALEFQIRQLFQRLFTARDASFVFHEGRTGPSKIGVHMNLTRLLLETSFEADERDRARA